MRFIELAIEKDPYAPEAQRFTWRRQKGLVKIHRHWAQGPNHHQFYFAGPEIVALEDEARDLNWTQAFASYYGLWNNP
jgi:hypothetical protein